MASDDASPPVHPTESDLRSLWERSQIERVINTERNGKDLGRWDQMLAAYHPDAQLGGFWFQGTAAQFVDSSRRSFEAGLRQVHLLGPMDIRLNGDRALAEFNVLIRAHLKIEGVDAVSNTSTRVYERLVKQGGAWLIVQMNSVYHSAEVFPVNPWEQIPFDRELLESYPPSYRYVAHTQASFGVKMHHDHLGIDRPGPIQDMAAANDAWLAGG